MSSTSSIAGSSAMAYATELAQTSSLKRSLYNIGNAIENADLATAGKRLTALMKAYPQYATSSTGTTNSSNPINDDFKEVSDAITKNDADGAKTAWAKLKADLADAGVKGLTDGTSDTSKLLADSKASRNQAILEAFFSTGSDSGADTLSTLLGSSTSASTDNSVNALVSNWLTHRTTGTSGASSSTSNTSGSILNKLG